MNNVFSVFKIDSVKGLKLEVAVVLLEGQTSGFGDQWVLTDKHEGGVTITNPEFHVNSYKFAIPQQTSLAELSGYFAAQGRANPSEEAFKSLQEALRRDLSASDYGFNVRATLGDVLVMESYSPAFLFDWSSLDDEGLDEVALNLFHEHCLQDAEAEALKCFQSLLNKLESLKSLVK